MRPNLSISVQILLAVLVTVITVLGISSIIDLNVLKHRQTRTLHDKGTLSADRIANSLAYPLWNLNREETERVVLDEIGAAEVFRIEVFDENNDAYVGKIRIDGVVKDIDANNAGATPVPNASLYSFSRDVNFGNTRIGRVILDVTDAPLQAELRELQRGVAIKLVLLVLLLSVVLFVALRILVIRPVSTLKSWVESLPSLTVEEGLAPRFKYSGEINSLADAFGSLSLNLRRKNEELVGEQARLRELNRQLKTSEEQLRALSARLHSAREEEGTRIAREIHDEMGGTLTSLKWDLERTAKDLSSLANAAGNTEMRQRIDSMTGLVESTINTVRRISSELRPGVLDDLGLVAAIDWQAQQFQSRTGIKCYSETVIDTVDLNRESATAVFRIFQEILTNVLRHAQANSIHVMLEEQDGYLELKVKDDGRGITESEKSNTQSLGILGMKERALLIGGEVNIGGQRGAGTTVVVRVPVVN
jgi:signal transduction histidine kinase